MKLRRPRVRRVIGWASVLTGAMLMLIALFLHLCAWGALQTNTLWLDGLRPHAGRINFVMLDNEELTASPAPTRRSADPGWGPRTFSTRGLSLYVSKAAAGVPQFHRVFSEPPATPITNEQVYRATITNALLRASRHNATVYATRGPVRVFLVVHAAWLWALGAPMFAAPIALRWRTLRRRPKRACKHCGYDMAGLPLGAACPECGGVASR